ncbi:MAG TPA: sigma-70 family RNA polymerase sigma factor [Polyangiaceae bacterium]|nr:sigma-70 family RNA polymerase sigma factor [Polyangiaceae bacterium]
MTEPQASPQSPGVVPDTRAVFAAEFSWVYRTLQRFGVRSADLEDLTHDVFVVFHARRGEFDASRALKPWLMGIAFRVASDYRRRASHRNELLQEPEEQPDSKPNPELATERARSRELLLRGFETIEPDRLAVLLLHDVDGVAAPQIAEALGIPLNTAYSRLRLARRDLAKAVAQLTPREA